MKIKRLHVFSSTLILLGGAGCQIDTSSDGSGGKDSLMNIVVEPAGDNCPVGGQKILSGLDTDKNGELEETEVLQTSYVCSGKSVIANMSDELAGDNCAEGGKRIDSGVDDNSDGVLDAEEIDVTSFVCNGPTGSAGPAGSNSLVGVTAEVAGINCAAGGFKIDSGVDDNANSVLEVGEIDSSPVYLCNGEQGVAGAAGLDGAAGATGAQGDSSLLVVNIEAEGSNCALGGHRIDSGVDDNGNSILDGAEVDETSYLCNSEPTETPLNDTGILLSSVTAEFGGYEFPVDCSNGTYGSLYYLQDCNTGWDNEDALGNLWKIGGGDAGFDFTPFTVNTDSCVSDNHTDLMWEVKTSTGVDYRSSDVTVTLDGAKTSVQQMNIDQICGYTDWRLPSLKELHGLVHYGWGVPFIDETYFVNTAGVSYWTSGLRSTASNTAFTVDFSDGTVSSTSLSAQGAFRAVRGGKK